MAPEKFDKTSGKTPGKPKRILIGDDQIERIKPALDWVTDELEIVFVSSSTECIERAQNGDFDVVITDFQYTPQGEEGFTVLESLRGINVRKILYTALSGQPDVRKKAKKLGAEVLGKEELVKFILSIIDESKKRVLVYWSEDMPERIEALRSLLHGVYSEDSVEVSNELESNLKTGEYGLVISIQGNIKHRIQALQLSQEPELYELLKVSGRYLDEITQEINRFFNLEVNYR